MKVHVSAYTFVIGEELRYQFLTFYTKKALSFHAYSQWEIKAVEQSQNYFQQTMLNKGLGSEQSTRIMGDG